MITFGSMLLTVPAAVSVAIDTLPLVAGFCCLPSPAMHGMASSPGQPTTARHQASSLTRRWTDTTTCSRFSAISITFTATSRVFVVTALAMVGSTTVSCSRAKGDAVGINANVGYM